MGEEHFVIKENILIPEAYLDLRQSLNWDIFSLQDVASSLQNSLYTISIYKQELIIGAGRVVGDGTLCFYIQDIMVHPEYQGLGVGDKIMRCIMRYLNAHAVSNAYIGLMSKSSKEGFYQKYGFVARPNATMGAGMVIPLFKEKNSPSL